MPNRARVNVRLRGKGQTNTGIMVQGSASVCQAQGYDLRIRPPNSQNPIESAVLTDSSCR